MVGRFLYRTCGGSLGVHAAPHRTGDRAAGGGWTGPDLRLDQHLNPSNINITGYVCIAVCLLWFKD